MSDEPDGMVTAASKAFAHACGISERDMSDADHEAMRLAIVAALAATPTVDGWVLCQGYVMRDPHCGGHGLALGNCGEDCGPCAHAHYDLIARTRTGDDT
jgi:hypothetical protein